MSVKSKEVEKEKVKAKPKSKPKAKASTAAKSKSTTTRKAAAKSPAKKPVKAKAVAKSKSKPKSTSVTKTKVKRESKAIKSKSNGKKKGNGKAMLIPFTEKQKSELLVLIEQFVNLHKNHREGLLVLTGVEQILNKYNQKYTEPDEKFDAIARFGVEKDPRIVHEHFYVNVLYKKKEVDELFILLTNIAHGKVEYAAAAEKMRDICKSALSPSTSSV